MLSTYHHIYKTYCLASDNEDSFYIQISIFLKCLFVLCTLYLHLLYIDHNFFFLPSFSINNSDFLLNLFLISVIACPLVNSPSIIISCIDLFFFITIVWIRFFYMTLMNVILNTDISFHHLL